MGFLFFSVSRLCVTRLSQYSPQAVTCSASSSSLQLRAMSSPATPSNGYAGIQSPCPPSRIIITIVIALTILISLPTVHRDRIVLFPASLTRSADNSSSHLMVAFSTAPNMETARKIADDIVGKRLAACVNIVPGAESVYWWEGKVEREQEVLMIIKTRRELMDKLNQSVGELHPYDVHELVGMDIKGGGEKYLKWVWEETVGKEVGKES